MRSVRSKLLLFSFLSQALVLSALILFAYQKYKDDLETHFVNTALSNTYVASHYVVNSLETKNLDKIEHAIEDMMASSDVEYVQVKDTQRRVLAHLALDTHKEISAKVDVDIQGLDDDSFDVEVELFNDAGELLGYMQTGMNVRELRSNIAAYRDKMVYIALAGLSTILLVSLLMGNFVTRRLRDLLKVTNAMKQGEFGNLVEVSGSDEIADALRAINLLSSELKYAEVRRSAIFNVAMDSIVVVDRHGIINDINPAGEKAFGFKREQVIGKSLSETLVPGPLRGFHDAKLRSFIGESPQQKTRDHKIEVSALRSDGTEFPVEILVSSIEVEDEVLLIAFIHDLSDIKNKEMAISNLSYGDRITGLSNRESFVEGVGAAIEHSKKHQSEFGMLLLDLDRFKHVNDSLGHHYGDNLIRQVGQRLSEVMHKNHLVARLGGDEFACLVPEIKDVDVLADVAQKVINSLTRPYLLDDKQVFIGVSIGISCFPIDSRKPEELMKHAEVAMYHAKEHGGNRFEYYSSNIGERAAERLRLENELRFAIENEQLELYYQPQVDLRDGKIYGVEALVRWNHPVEGLIPPVRFISLAEETGLILPMGEWIIDRALSDIHALHKEGFQQLKVSVNVSPRQFKHNRLVDCIYAAIERHSFPANLLEIELTESTLVQDTVIAHNILDELSSQGITIALDDFGTGYSSLSYLKKYPISNIKIDRSFVRDVTVDTDDASIVSAIIQMARSLGIDSISEGVETIDQLMFLLSVNCERVQGYYFSRPIELKALRALLQQSDKVDMDSLRAKAKTQYHKNSGGV